ncbi:MAG: TIM barrel protein [Acidobacteria bacterium]|nr:TIM barrel protein [Acidobacteriota bacterium]
MLLDRRLFLAVAAGAVGCGGPSEQASAPPEAAAGKMFEHPLGAQLYTVRSVLPEDPAKVLQDLAAIGYKEVEVLQLGYDELAPLVKDAGLQAVSMHLRPGVITGVWGPTEEKPPQATLETAIPWAKQHGVSYVVMPYLPAEQRPDSLDGFKALAEKLTTAAQAAKAAGLGFAYHNHAFEFQPMEGSTPLDTLMAASDPATVGLELDVFWVSIAGNDPVALLQKYAGRVPLTHLKDKAADAPTQFAEGAPKEAFKEVGHGVLDFPAILAACEQAGVAHYFVEQDQTPGDPLASLRQSYEYLHSVRLEG